MRDSFSDSSSVARLYFAKLQSSSTGVKTAKKWFRFFCDGFIFRASHTLISSAARFQKASDAFENEPYLANSLFKSLFLACLILILHVICRNIYFLGSLVWIQLPYFDQHHSHSAGLPSPVCFILFSVCLQNKC